MGKLACRMVILYRVALSVKGMWSVIKNVEMLGE